MFPSRFARRLAPLAGVAVLVLPAFAVFIGVASAANAVTSTGYQNTQTFRYSAGNQEQHFTVPPAVTQVFFQAVGGGGGRGGASGLIAAGAGGNGGAVTGTVNVTPGADFTVFLGELGHSGSSGSFLNSSAGGGASAASNGGGKSGASDSSVSGSGGGGGAATEIDAGGQMLALAGGGGGGGGGGAVAGLSDGGSGANAGAANLGGSNGSGIGAGSGGGIFGCLDVSSSHVGGDGTNGTNIGGGGGGGGGGYGVVFCGGKGGSGGGTGGGGGGGGGAGASYVDGSRVAGSQVGPSGTTDQGYVTFTWSQPASSTTVTAAASYAHTAHFVATVAPASVTSPTPTGTVDFYANIGGTDVYIASTSLDAAGVATINTQNVSAGTFSLVARYTGDAVYAPSSSFRVFTFTPTSPAPPMTTSASESLIPRRPLSGTLYATVTRPSDAPSWAPVPGGIVTFYDTTDTANPPVFVGNANVDSNGKAGVDVLWNGTPPTYNYRADYAGDTNYGSSSTTLAVPVDPTILTTTTLTSSKSTLLHGQAVTFTITVKPQAGNAHLFGVVGLYENSHLIADAPIGDSTTITTTDLPVGAYDVTASYSDNGGHTGSTSPPVHEVVSEAQPPVAKAGSAQTVYSGATFKVDGSASTDPQGESLAYQWTQLDGPAATFADDRAARTNVTAPKVTTKTVIHLRLRVTNTAGWASTSDVAITVNPK